MQKIVISEPPQYLQTIELAVRITDLNFGNHVGNDAWVGLLHEARAQFLACYGWHELSLAGTGLIMTDLAIQFKKELFYPSRLRMLLGIGSHSAAGFDLVYRLEVAVNDGWQLAGLAKTGMLCFDYAARKVARLPAKVIQAWELS